MHDATTPGRHYRQRINPYWLDTLEQLDLPLSHARAEGAYLYDEEGRAWLDLVAGYGSVSLGHNHPWVTERVVRYLQGHHPATHPWGANLQSAALAERLAQASPLPDARVVFSCTGAEAVEAALKLAMAHTGRDRFIAFERGFHGLTLGAMGLNGHPAWSAPLPASLAARHRIVPAQGLDACLSCIASGEYAAVVLEPVQGIGGGFAWQPEALGELAAACRRHATLLIVDEVQTGMGRTGALYASERFPVGHAPDIIVLAKGLTGGALPLSATLCAPAVHHSLFGRPGCARIHGSTYTGYGAGIAAAHAVLDYIEGHALLAQVNARSAALRGRLADLARRHPRIASIDGAGLLVTVTFGDDAPDLAAYCLQQFFANDIHINLSAHRPNTIKFTPPLTIGADPLALAAEVLGGVLDAYTADLPN